MKTFNLLVSIPEETFFEGKVSSLKAKNPNGEFQILANYEPFVSIVSPSTLTLVDENGTKSSYFISEGVIETKGDKVILCVNSIDKKEDIDLAKAEEAKVRAEQRLASNQYNIDRNRAKLSLARAKERIKFAK